MLELGDLAQKLFFSGGEGLGGISTASDLFLSNCAAVTHGKINTTIIDHYGDFG